MYNQIKNSQVEYKIDPHTEYEICFFSKNRKTHAIVKTAIIPQFIHIHTLFDRKFKDFINIKNDPNINGQIGELLFKYANFSSFNVETCLEADEVYFMHTLFGKEKLKNPSIYDCINYSRVAEKTVDFLSSGTFTIKEFQKDKFLRPSIEPEFHWHEILKYVSEKYNWTPIKLNLKPQAGSKSSNTKKPVERFAVYKFHGGSISDVHQQTLFLVCFDQGIAIFTFLNSVLTIIKHAAQNQDAFDLENVLIEYSRKLYKNDPDAIEYFESNLPEKESIQLHCSLNTRVNSWEYQTYWDRDNAHSNILKKF